MRAHPDFFSRDALHLTEKEHRHLKLRLRTPPEKIPGGCCDDYEVRVERFDPLLRLKQRKALGVRVYELRPVPSHLKERPGVGKLKREMGFPAAEINAA